METLKTLKSQNNLEEEEKKLVSNYTTKLQSSKQYGTGTKIDTWLKGTKQRIKNEPMLIWVINL